MPPIRPRPRGEIGGRLGGDWVEIGWRLGEDHIEDILALALRHSSWQHTVTSTHVRAKKKSKNISINLYIISINLSYLAVF